MTDDLPSDDDWDREAAVARARLVIAAIEGAPLPGDVGSQLEPAGVIGALSRMSLTETMQMMDFGKKNGRVDVFLHHAYGVVHVHDGQIVRAAATTSDGEVLGEPAFLLLSREAKGFFRIQYDREDVVRNVHRPTTFVLLEALRTIDEAANGEDTAAAFAPDGDDQAASEPTADPEQPAPQAAWETDVTMSDLADLASVSGEHSREEAEALASALPASSMLDALAEADFLIATGDAKGAQAILLNARDSAPDDDDVSRRLKEVNLQIDAARAVAHLRSAERLLGKPEAIEHARAATALWPAREALLRALAVFAHAASHADVADTAARLMDLDSDDEGAMRIWLHANIELGRWMPALRTAEALSRRHPGDEELKALLLTLVARTSSRP